MRYPTEYRGASPTRWSRRSSSRPTAASAAGTSSRGCSRTASCSSAREIDDDVANVVIAQLLFLESEDPDKDIMLYINSPGGDVSAGLAIYDTMQCAALRRRDVLHGPGGVDGAASCSRPAPRASATRCRTRA